MSKLHSLRLSVSVALLLGAIALPAQSQQADGAKLFFAAVRCLSFHSRRSTARFGSQSAWRSWSSGRAD